MIGIENQEIARNHARGAAVATAAGIKNSEKCKNNASSVRGGSVNGIEKREIARNNARGAAVAATAGI